MDACFGWSSWEVHNRHLIELKKCAKEIKIENKAVLAKLDRLRSIDLQFRKCLYTIPQCIDLENAHTQFSNAQTQFSNAYEQCLNFMEERVKNAEDYNELKQKDQEIGISLLNVKKLLDEKQKEKVNTKFLIRQLEHENNAYKNKIKGVEKELSQLKRKLSAKQRSHVISKKTKSSRAVRFLNHLFKLGKIGDKDMKLLKSMIEGKEDNSVEDDKDGFNHITSGSNISAKGVLSPDERLGLSSTSPPVNQHANSGDCDSDFILYNDSEGRELQQDDKYLDVQQPIEADESNVEEGSEDEVNQVEDSNSGSSIVNEIYVYSQENDSEQSVDEDDLYGWSVA